MKACGENPHQPVRRVCKKCVDPDSPHTGISSS